MSRAQYPVKRFAVDIMLGKLAKWLRALGFDARSMPLDDEARVGSLISEGYIPVTRREKFQDREGIIFIRSDNQFEQLKELISTLNVVIEELRPFSRCSLCNAELIRIPAETVFGAVPDYVFETVSDFRKCPECSRVYWPGSHRKRMIDKLKSATGLDLREEGLDGGE
jgi:uncharacterized protein with PIN domain